jgi:hypothetical protein
MIVKEKDNNIMLSTLNVLPILVNGKVVVINNNNSYTTYKVAQYTTIKDNFNPWEYCISPYYHNTIISAKYGDIKKGEELIINRYLNNKKRETI